MSPEHDRNPSPASGAPASDGHGRDEVARRVRRLVGFKVMRDLHREASAMEAQRRRRPRLVALLMVCVAVIAAVVAGFVYLLYR